ncbi:hypothetical protein SAMN05443667_11513 [Flavobacterium gillisiae]|uniref:CHAT domain-containing protein n=1 Tax=Flavobacterium gillisiae TaxID=150146 RepID=A0A1H4FU90_9FLAO|nr:hypothetical protein [Flavobacterium gillisiae]SEB00854.1 hypothetical protein SAMN05443667_11513 [Flavobacterium gillisiae]
MIQIIISIDPSTKFLFEIIEKLSSKGIEYNLTEIHPNEESYRTSFENISNFDKNSIILFFGHGQSNQLYGGESPDSFTKKPFIRLNEMSIFQEQYLFLLACDSASLIKSSFRMSKTIKSIGFGALPTSIEEIENDKKLSLEGISVQTIEDFKKTIVDTVSNALLISTKDFIHLKDYLILLVDKKINDAVLLKNDRNLADLLYRMRNEMVVY